MYRLYMLLLPLMVACTVDQIGSNYRESQGESCVESCEPDASPANPDANPEPSCGDQVCDEEETCETCPLDCGQCPCPTGTSGECESPDAGTVPPPPDLGETPPEQAPPLDTEEPVDPEYTVEGGGCATGGGSTVFLGFLILLGLFLARRKKSLFIILPLLISAPALAQNVSQEPADIDIERFDLTMDSSSILNVEGAEAQPNDAITISGWAGYANDPLVLINENTDERVGELVGDRYSGGLGVAFSFDPRVQLGLSLPLIFHQARDVGSIQGTGNLQSFGLGDVSLGAKIYLMQERLDLALDLGASLPTNTTDSYFGSDNIRPRLGVILAKRDLFKGFRAAMNLGVEVISDETLGDLRADHELYGRLGLARGFGRNEVGVTFNQSMRLSEPLDTANRNYSEVMAGLTRYYNSGLTPFVGGGMGLNEGYGSPDYRVFLGFHYQPRHTPRGKDNHTPPLPPEPEPPVVVPEPPVEPAPEPVTITIDDAYFSFDKALLTAAAKSMLTDVALQVKGGQEVTLTITGHTDAVGTDAYNIKLGKRRAQAVFEFLMDQGVDQGWMTVDSKGESEPRATNKTVSGRAENRRVEIFIEGAQHKGGKPDGSTDDTLGHLPKAK